MYVTHLTSAHQSRDTRIFLKQCSSISQYGHNATLIVAESAADAIINGITIRSVRPSTSRMGRMLLVPWRLFAAARSVKTDLFILHDPELIPIGLVLRILRARVVFDAHEDLPKQVFSKPYLPGWASKPVSWLAFLLLRFLLPWFTCVLAANADM